MTVGDAIAAFLEKLEVTMAFGVVSIHNMPILDAFNRRGNIRFVPARGEAGAIGMADAHARVSGGLGVAVTSTGTAAGNAAGAMVEAMTAGTPLLHITGQIDSPYLDRHLGFLHEARDQLGMLQAVSKAAFRISSPETLPEKLREAARVALTPPTGPVSVEIPIDVQQATFSGEIRPARLQADDAAADSIDALIQRLSRAKRPLLWLGGGARGAGDAVRALVDKGFGVVSSVQGRGIVPEDHPMTLGAFNIAPPVEAFYATCDALVVCGSRLRSNETLGYRLKLPQPLYRIDAERQRADHPYRADLFVNGECREALEVLAKSVSPQIDPGFAKDLQAAKAAALAAARAALGPYAGLVDALQRHAGREFLWVRDVTVSNSTWGNRLLQIFRPRDGVHALGGGIGQGVPMAIGAALAGGGRKALCLTGDGGLQLCLGELATAVQEKANILFIVMNDRGYGVIRNIWDAAYGGRRAYTELVTPNLRLLSEAVGLPCRTVRDASEFGGAISEAMGVQGPAMVEIDMDAIGPYPGAFAGPPVRKAEA